MAKTNLAYLLRFWMYLKRYRFGLMLAFVLIPLLTVMHLWQPYLLKLGIDQYMMQEDLDGLYGLSILFGLAVVLEFVFRSVQSYLFQYIGQKTVSHIRSDLFKHIQSLSLSYFDRTPLGEMTSRLTSDVESLNESFSSGMVTLLSDLLILIGIFGMMLYLNAKLALISICFVPFIIVLMNFIRVQMRHLFNRIRNTTGTLNAFLQEQLQGVLMIQLFQRESVQEAMFEDANRRYRHVVMKSVSYDAVLYSLIESMSFVVIAVLLWYGLSGELKANGITLGLLVAFIDYTYKLFAPLKDLSSKFTILQHALAALEKIFGAFDVKEHILDGDKSLAHVEGRIHFRDVSFAYRGHEDKPILKKISFDMQPGQVVAIVGPTGAGKTTISRLISRLYEGYEGQITLDGVNVKEIRLNDLRRNIAAVLQDVYLLSRSIAFNITMGDERISREAMIAAAKLAQAHEFIERLPQGYETVLNAKNVALSQGEAQLISFARALTSPAPIVLLDEATASVDSLNEQKIQAGIEQLLKKKTALVIAHRLSTIQKADHILALKDGAIVEQGSHEELMVLNGFYAKLFRMQFMHL